MLARLGTFMSSTVQVGKQLDLQKQFSKVVTPGLSGLCCPCPPYLVPLPMATEFLVGQVVKMAVSVAGRQTIQLRPTLGYQVH